MPEMMGSLPAVWSIRQSKDMPVEGSLSGKASTALDNINATGEKKIKDVATNAMLENVETLKDAMGTDEIAENSKDFMTSGAMYTAAHDLQEDWTGTLDSLTKTFAMDDATNLTEENKQKWRATLGTGTNKRRRHRTYHRRHPAQSSRRN